MDPKAVELRKKVVAVLSDKSLDDRALLSALEKLAAEDSLRFPGFSHLFGPVLYERNRNAFRTFLLAHFNAFSRSSYYDDEGNAFDPWKKQETRASLERLLDRVDRDGEVQLFRKLYDEHIGGRWYAPERWRDDVRKRFVAARTETDRRRVLEMFDLAGVELDEASALAMYEAAPSLCADFLLAHAPRETAWDWGKKLPPWRELRERAVARGDLDFEHKLFRRQATPDEWSDRVRRLISKTASAQELVDQLEEIHPELMPKNAAEVYHALLEMRGADALPYVMKHLDLRRSYFWSSKPIGSDKLIRLAASKGWLQLWAALIRSSTQETYNDAVRELLKEQEQRDQIGMALTRRKLQLLAGVGRELNFPGFGIAQVMPLKDDTAVALYRHFPDLVRTVFRAHVVPGWGAVHMPLTRAALHARDEELVDWIASRAVTLMGFGGWFKASKDQTEICDELSRHYEKLIRDPNEFARRAGNVLSAVPPGAIWSYDGLIKNNRLARLLFERSHEDYLADPSVVRDLLESPQIYVNRLAFRILSVDSPRARELAERNLDLLCACLLRKLHSQTRAEAIDALANAVGSEEAACKALDKARDALRLPEKRYPREKLIALIGSILHRHAPLRTDREQPKVFACEVRT